MKKLSVSELLRLACIYAEQDRIGLLDAYRGCNSPEDVNFKEELTELIKQLRDYRIKRWGKSAIDILDEATSQSYLNMKTYDE